MAASEISQPAEKICRRGHKTTFAKLRFDDDRGHMLGRDAGREQFIQFFKRTRCRPTSILVRKRRVIDLARAWTEILLVSRIRRRHCQRQHRPSMKSAGERDDRLAFGVSARDLDGVFSRFSAGGHEQRLTLRSSDQCVQPRGEFHIAVVHADLAGHVRQSRQLISDGRNDARMTMANVLHADPAREIEVLLTLLIPYARALRAGDGQTRMRDRESARHGVNAASVNRRLGRGHGAHVFCSPHCALITCRGQRSSRVQ